MTEDAQPIGEPIIVFPTELDDKIQKAFKDLRETKGEKFEPETNFDFGSDDFGWM